MIKKVLPAIFPLILLCACSVPKRAPVPPGTIPQGREVTVEDEQYGHQVLNALNERWEIDYNDPRLSDIESIVERLTKAAGVDQRPWHVYLLKAPEVKNAAATRGNHVFVWSGMLDATKSNDELATIIAHEIAHVLANHTDPDPNEQIKQLLIQAGAFAAGVAVYRASGSAASGQNLGRLTQALTDQVGKGILVNPYSRERELEADHIGLFLMADAKINPEAAIDFWRRAEQDPSFGTSNEFFSTHPLATNRLGQLQSLLPQAIDRYKGIRPKRERREYRNIVPYPAPIENRNTGVKDSFDWGN